MDERGGVAVAAFAVLTVVTIAILFLGTRSPLPLPARLIGLGVFFALVALWYGLLTGLPTRDHGAMPFLNPGLADTALRLAAVLVLGGIVVSLLVRDTVPPLPIASEASRNVPPNL
jgi:hypothetical protein